MANANSTLQLLLTADVSDFNAKLASAAGAIKSLEGAVAGSSGSISGSMAASAGGMQVLDEAATEAASSVETAMKQVVASTDSAAESAKRLADAEKKAAADMKEAADKEKQAAAEVQAGLMQLSMVFTGVAAGGALMTKMWLDKASEMQTYRATLNALTGDTEVTTEKMKYFVEYAATTKFNLPQVVDAGVKIQGLGSDVKKFLPAAAAMATALGKDLPETALTMVKAANGSRDAITQMRDTLLIGRDQLREYGVEYNKNGEIILNGVKDQEKFTAAVLSYVNAKYGDVIAAQSQTLAVAFSGVTDMAGQLSAELGEELAPAALEISKFLGGLIEVVRNMPPGLKQFAAMVVPVGAALATIAATVTGAVVAFTMFGPAIGAALTTVVPGSLAAASAMRFMGTGAALMGKEVAGSVMELGLLRGIGPGVGGALAVAGDGAKVAGLGMQAMAVSAAKASLAFALTPMGAFLLAATALAGGLLYLTNAEEEATAATEAEILAQKKVIKEYKEHEQATRTATDTIRKYGKVNQEVSQEIADAWKAQGIGDKDIHSQLVMQFQHRDRLQQDILDKEAMEAQLLGESAEEKERMIQAWKEEGIWIESSVESLRGSLDVRLQIIHAMMVARGLISGTSVLQEEAHKKLIARADAAAAAMKKHDDDATANLFKNKREEEADLLRVEKEYVASAEALKLVDKRRYQEMSGVAKTFALEDRKIHKESVKEQAEDAVKSLERQAQFGQITKQQEAAALLELGKKYQEVYGFRMEMVVKAGAVIKASAEEISAAELKTLESSQKTIDQKLSGMEKQLSRGGDLVAQEQLMMDLVNRRTALEIEAIKKKLAADVEKNKANPGVVAQLHIQAANDIAQAEQAAGQKRLDIEDKVSKAKADQLKAVEAVQAAELKATGAAISSLEARLGRGEAVGKQLDEQLKKQEALEIQILKTKKAEALAVEHDPKKRASIEKQATFDIEAAHTAATEKRQKSKDDETKRSQDANIKATELAKQEEELELSRIQKRKAAGASVRAEEENATKRIFELEQQKIRQQAEKDKFNKNAMEAANVERQAHYDMAASMEREKEALKAIAASYDKGKKTLEEQHSELKSIEDQLKILKGEEKDKGGPIIGGVEELVAQQKREEKKAELEKKARDLRKSTSRGDAVAQNTQSTESESDKRGTTINGATVEQRARDEERRERDEARAKIKNEADAARKKENMEAAQARLERQGKTPEEIAKIFSGANWKDPYTKPELPPGSKSGGLSNDFSTSPLTGGGKGGDGKGDGQKSMSYRVEEQTKHLSKIETNTDAMLKALNKLAGDTPGGASDTTGKAQDAAKPQKKGSQPQNQLSKSDQQVANGYGYPGATNEGGTSNGYPGEIVTG